MNAMYSVEQVNVPPEMGTIMKQYTKAVLRDKPKDVYKYSANFFAVLCGKPSPFDADGQLVESSQNGSVSYDAVAQPHQVVSEVSKDDGNDEIEMTEQEAVLMIFDKYDINQDGVISVDALPDLLADIRATLGLGDDDLPSADDVLQMMHCDGDLVDLLELRQLLFESEEDSR